MIRGGSLLAGLVLALQALLVFGKPGYLQCSTYPTWVPNAKVVQTMTASTGYMGAVNYKDGADGETCLMGMSIYDVNSAYTAANAKKWPATGYVPGSAYLVTISSKRDLGRKLKVTAGILSEYDTPTKSNDPTCRYFQDDSKESSGMVGWLKTKVTHFLWQAPIESKKVKFYALCGELEPGNLWAAPPKYAWGPDPCPDFNGKDCKHKKKGRKKGCQWKDTSTCEANSSGSAAVCTPKSGKSKWCKKAKKQGCFWEASGQCANPCRDPSADDVVCSDRKGKKQCVNTHPKVCKYKKRKCSSKCG